MGKLGKERKARKDFQKVKFKVGKKLPKNTNETRATFKAKTLVLKQQFKLDKEGPVSHRNLSWKVSHNSFSSRVFRHILSPLENVGVWLFLFFSENKR
jgi:hypothetical protein